MKVFKKDGGLFERKGIAAGYDMVATKDTKLYPWKKTLVPTGVHLAIPTGHVGLLSHRSSTPHKLNGMVIMGKIDEDYRGEVYANVMNIGEDILRLDKGIRYFQMTIIPCTHPLLEEVDDVWLLGDTERGQGGFGSTG